MWFGILTLATALIISVSAAYYSILGLTAIFAAAFWPIVILGSSLEVGKIVSTLWLHKYWERAELQYKVYLCTAVAILMVLTSMGVFGFLSKAHTDQSLTSGDVVAKISIYDEKIKQSRDNIDMARRALTQMDAAVDQTLGRSSTEQGADKAAQLRRSQTNERNRLLKEIDTEQKKIQKISEERAPIAAEVRKVEAEVGPIKYIAALIYGDNPEANVLEKSVRWVIILIVIVFDPLALTLLLAATKSIEWERGINIMTPAARRPEESKDDEDPELKEWFDDLKEKSRAMDAGTYNSLTPQEQKLAQEVVQEEPNPYQAIEPDKARWYDHVDEEQPVQKENSRFRVLSGLNDMWNSNKEKTVIDPEAEHAQIETPQVNIESSIEDTIQDERKLETICERVWKKENPGKTLKHQRQLHRAGLIDELPWNNIEFRERALKNYSMLCGFGSEFPDNAIKGDMFLRVDTLPSTLYKFNGAEWIAVDKTMSDQYAYNDAYLDYLIGKIATGEYDLDLLSDAERDGIEQRLKNNSDKI
jgi:hypothetical protein